MRATRRGLTAAVGAGVIALVIPAAAVAAPPGATTGAATRITVGGATLTGQVNLRGAATTYHFEYGVTRAYTASTPPANAGAGSKSVRVSATVAGLAAGTGYHYRLVASSPGGTTRGRDRQFATRAPRPAVTLNATPSSVLFGGPVTFTGTVSGARIAGRRVQLRQSPFPFSGRFADAGSAVLTNAQGAFTVTLASVPLSTRFRVRVGGNPSVVSPVVAVGVLARVGTRVTRTRVRRGGRVRFSGTVRPAEVNRPLAVQRRRNGRWVTVAGMVTRPSGPDVAVYGKTIRVRRAGLYRVFLGTGSGATGPNVGRTIRLRLSR